MTVNVPEEILFYAFRYALGRRTYAVSDVVDAILKQWPAITDKTINMMKKEIEEAIDKGHAGDFCDVQEWRKILELKRG